MSPEAKCAFESERKNAFCPVAQDSNRVEPQTCDACVKASTRKGKDLAMPEFLLLHPEFSHTQAGKLLLNHLDKNPPAVDPTPWKSIHQRLMELPSGYKDQILAQLEK